MCIRDSLKAVVCRLNDRTISPRAQLTANRLMSGSEHMEHVGHDVQLHKLESRKGPVVNLLRQKTHARIETMRVEGDQPRENQGLRDRHICSCNVTVYATCVADCTRR